MAKQWYIIQAYSNFENKVKESLEDKIKEKDQQSLFGEILIPTETVVDVSSTKGKTSERKFFPGYVLVEMEMTDETWSLVNSVDKVVGFLGGSVSKRGEVLKPSPISNEEFMQITQRVNEGIDKPRPKVVYEAGESISITDGPFDGFSGLIQSVDYDKSSLQVEVQILGRSTVVKLAFSQITKD